jgi:hypothetical protein
MAQISAVVYDAPSPKFPALAVLFHENEVLVARAVHSIVAGEALIARLIPEFQAKIDRGE